MTFRNIPLYRCIKNFHEENINQFTIKLFEQKMYDNRIHEMELYVSHVNNNQYSSTINDTTQRNYLCTIDGNKISKKKATFQINKSPYVDLTLEYSENNLPHSIFKFGIIKE
jgi:hypothetical protein